MAINNFTFSKFLFTSLLTLGAVNGVSAQEEQDARLKLTVSLDNVMCYGETKTLTIDTVGTGAFRNGSPKLTVTATSEDSTVSEIKDLKLTSNGLLEVEVSPIQNTSYYIQFSYGNQLINDTVDLQVWNPKVTTDRLAICEGESVELNAILVSSIDAKIQWYDEDKTTLLGDNGTAVYPSHLDSNNEIYQHTYYAKPYSDLVYCENTPMTAMTVDVQRSLKGSISYAYKICEGDSVTIDASSYGADSYTCIYAPSGDTVACSSIFTHCPEYTGCYYVQMNRGLCHAEDDACVEVVSLPFIESIDSISFRTVEIIMSYEYGERPFTYIVDGDTTKNPVIDGLTYSMHSVKIIDANGCTTTDSFNVIAPSFGPLVDPNFRPDDGVESILAENPDEIVNVCTFTGVLVKTNVKKRDALVGLKPGAYIVGKNKIVVK